MIIRDSGGADVTILDTSGRIIWGLGPLKTIRPVASDVWRTGRVTQDRVSAAGSTYLTEHRVMADARDLLLTYGGNLPVGVSMDCAVAVEVAGKTRRQGAWGGASSTTLTGDTVRECDPIDIQVRAGDVLHVYTYYGPRSDGLNHPASPAARYSNEILPGDQTLTGTARIDGTYPGSLGYWSPMPHLIRGATHEDQQAWVLLGDSITESGSPDAEAAPYGRQQVKRTWAHRALDDRFPLVNTGMWAGQYATERTGGWATIPDLTGATDAVIAWGYNDLNGAWANSSRDVRWVQDRAITTWTWVHAEVPRLWQTTVTPNTLSTDGWTTIEGQTVVASQPYRDAYNAWLRDGAPLDGMVPIAPGDPGVRAGEDGHPLAGILDTAAQLEHELGSGIFRVDHGPLTTDGGHPNTVGHDLMARAFTD